MKLVRCLLLLLAIGVASSPMVGAPNWKDDLKQKLDEAYKYAKRSTANPDRVTEPGTVLVIRKEGVSGDLSRDLTYSPVKVRNGEIRQAGGFAAFVADKKTTFLFKPGERVYVTGVRVADDNVMLMLIAVDTTAVNVKGSTQQTRYKAAIQFEYDKKELPTLAFEKIKADIDAMIASEEAVKAASTKTIALGQTPAEVETILGKPETVANLGTKTIYTYKSMKVIFTDGKVSDVQ